MSVHDSDRTSNVDENRSIGASSSAAAVSSGTPRQLFNTRRRRWAWSSIVDRHEVVVVEFSNSSITYRKVHRQVGRCSVDALASLDSSVTVDRLRRTA